MAKLHSHDEDALRLMRAFGLDPGTTIKATIRFGVGEAVTITAVSYVKDPDTGEAEQVLRRYRLEEIG